MAQVFFRKKIYSSRTLGSKLRFYRKKKKITLSRAEEETKVRLKYLQALENGDYGQLPADVYAMGFLIKYADFLGAPREELIKDFRQERASANTNPIPIKTKLKREKFVITPKVVTVSLGILLGLALVAYIFYSIENFISPPNLEILSPVTEMVLKQDKIDVIGKTDPGCTVAINDQVVYLDDKGNFTAQVRVQEGINNIEIKSTNRVRKETVKVVKLLAEY